MKENSKQNSVTFEIIQELGKLSTAPSGWSKEANIVSWNERPQRLDIREWDPTHNKMSRGVGLNATELAKFLEIVNNLDISELGI